MKIGDQAHSPHAAPIESGPPSPQGRGVHRLTALAIILLSFSTTWVSLADHPLKWTSEARYSLISRLMAADGRWLTPHAVGEYILHKPPLIYWSQAACILLVGPTHLATRLPSAIAGSLTLLAVLLIGWRLRGLRVGLVAMAMLSLMPMFVLVNRTTLTDSLLSLFWFITLVAGYLAVAAPTRGRQFAWAGLLWLCVALGQFDKGPVALIPVGILILWLALARRWADLRKLHIYTGLGLSLVPLILWVIAVARTIPVLDDGRTIWVFWWQETIGRFGDEANHPAPFWYFLPIFLGGLFPATLFLQFPGLHFPWKNTWAKFTGGDESSLWLVAVVVPLVFFSIPRGKLPYYLLPMCAPLALITAETLLACVGTAPAVRAESGVSAAPAVHPDVRPGSQQQSDVRPGPNLHLPNPAPALCITAFVLAIIQGLLIATTLDDASFFLILPMAALAVLAGWGACIWSRRPAARPLAITLAYLLMAGVYFASFEIEDRVLAPDSAPQNAALISALAASFHASANPAAPAPAPGASGVSDTTAAAQKPILISYGFKAFALGYYYGDILYAKAPFERPLDSPAGLDRVLASLAASPATSRADVIIFTEPQLWLTLCKKNPALAARFQFISFQPLAPLSLLPDLAARFQTSFTHQSAAPLVDASRLILRLKSRPPVAAAPVH